MAKGSATKKRMQVNNALPSEEEIYMNELLDMPESSPWIYYFRYRDDLKRYECPEERDLVQSGHYSFLEIKEFLRELYFNDRAHKDWMPTGWLIFFIAILFLGMGLVLLGLYWWFDVENNNTKALFLILAIASFVIAGFIFIFSLVFAGLGDREYLRRREGMLPIIDAENRRVFHRKLNWRMSEFGSYITLKVGYEGPVCGFRKRDPTFEEYTLNGSNTKRRINYSAPTNYSTAKKSQHSTSTKSSHSSGMVTHSPRIGKSGMKVGSPVRAAPQLEPITEIKKDDIDARSYHDSNYDSFEVSRVEDVEVQDVRGSYWGESQYGTIGNKLAARDRQDEPSTGRMLLDSTTRSPGRYTNRA